MQARYVEEQCERCGIPPERVKYVCLALLGTVALMAVSTLWIVIGKGEERGVEA